MKQKIYSLIIGTLSVAVLFLLINSKNTKMKNSKKIINLEKNIKQKKDSLQLYMDKYEAETDFSLAGNPDARELVYGLIPKGEPSLYILEELYKTNDIALNNELVPYEGTMGGVMKINNARVLNSKWVIADYSDGYFWGEILLEYTIDSSGKVTFKTFNELLYPHR